MRATMQYPCRGLVYQIYALVVIPLVTHGVSTISRLQVWTQPLWLLLVPFVYVSMLDPGAFSGAVHYKGAALVIFWAAAL